MKAPCLYHHRVREGFFKLDQIPSEVVANVFKYIPTLDIGRMMVVCRGFNQILSTNPSLWRIVDLDETTSNHKALRIIAVFATRSKNTLVAIKTPTRPDAADREELSLIIESSKATLRRLDMSFEPQDDPDEDIDFFESFPVIERLNLTSMDLPEGEHIPGVLTMLAWNWVGSSFDWDKEVLGKISSVTTLYLDHENGFDNPGSLHHILNACGSSLVNLTLMCGCSEFTPLQIDLPNLSSLTLAPYGNFENLFTRPMPNLKHIEGSPMNLVELNLKNLQSMSFKLEDWGGDVDESYDSVEKMVKMIKDSSSTLTRLKIKTGEEGKLCTDPVLRILKADYLPPLCPLLSDLYISTEHEFSLGLLAEVMVSRNFAGEGWKFEGEGEDDDVRRTDEGEERKRLCSRLTLRLDASRIKEFKKAEKKVLSETPKWIARRAGRSEVREWDGK